MSNAEQRPARILTWHSGDNRFELVVHTDKSTLLLFDGQIVELANSDWTALAEAVRMVVPSASEGGKAKVAKARKPKQSAANQGSRWTPKEDKKLLHLWQEDGVTIEDLMQCFGRNGGGITSRLVRLGASPTRDDIRTESKRRAESISSTS
ncbi:hypothetical protein [Sphingobium baderi]|uniref:Uncharacterized protein n=1 Tax=Sphingobium baderi LL03 TaxID=1114964 RepID=T0GDQ8_9SPHN|nr:hypothetical protein [Sphingobium baderi]EQB01881.1 hypothetical protein L485_09615 [Sphingobium baderi LL03]KMS62321.1 hypothetical protein V475_08835 [Sphingobium baderi LL03]